MTAVPGRMCTSTSAKTANTMPPPKSLMLSTSLIPIVASGTRICTAAVTTRRPMDCGPVATTSSRWPSATAAATATAAVAVASS